MRRIRFIVLVVGVILGVLSPIAAQAAEVDVKPDRQSETRETDRHVAVLRDRADLAAAYGIDGWAERGSFVIDELQATAEASQAGVVSAIKASGAGFVEAFWLSNIVVFEGDDALAARVGSLAGVKEVRKERSYEIARPVATAAAEAGSEPEWGVARIGAPDVWDRGILGSGIVVASLDSGVDYLHPAIVDRYRGNNGDGTFTHDYNWFDASGDCPTTSPCDLFGHGTHTMGTMVGGDGPGPFTPDIGVAPGAEWITVSCGPGFCSESQLLTAGQWFLAPTDLSGDNPDPSKRPDIINNSWGGFSGDTMFLDTVQAWRAAGIVPVFAAGNSGPSCGSNDSPGDFIESFTAGATDIDDLIADFSGRGPSSFDKPSNPDVSAPGVDVISSVPGGGYESFSGTSMAAPHVVGALALVMSAAPDLIGDVDAATSAIRATALDIVDQQCGGDEDGDPNNVYGDGRIDAAAATELAATGGVLAGTVVDAETAAPIGGARITAGNGDREFKATTAADGTFKLFLGAGMYAIGVSAFGYETSVTSGVEIVTDQTTELDVTLQALPTGAVVGVVTDLAGSPMRGVTVAALGVPVTPFVTGNSGRYRLVLPIGDYTLRASAGGCTTTADMAVVVPEAGVTVDFTLLPQIDKFGHGCREARYRYRDINGRDSLFGDDVYGRLPLPFPFPFYGDTYDSVYITTNGFISFEDPFYAEFTNTAIPSAQAPNNAVYALWQDLVIDEGSFVETSTSNQLQAFIIEFNQVRVITGEARANIQVKLWKNGTIDLIYGPGTESLGAGTSATIGIEDAPGRDALQVGNRQRVLRDGMRLRIEEVPTGVVAGVVTNVNDGLPVAGAKVTAEPSGRSATTGPDGAYSLRLVPGDFELTATATNYVTQSQSVTIADRSAEAVDFVLDAPQITIGTRSIDVVGIPGGTEIRQMRVRNTGTAPLEWSGVGVESEVVPPDFPTPFTASGQLYVRPNGWFRPDLPSELRSPEVRVAAPTFAGPLDVVLNDPVGDAVGAVDVTTIRGAIDAAEMSIEIEVTPESPLFETVGFFMLDTDQDSTTGIPAESLSGLPTQDLGVDFFLDLFYAPEGIALVVDAELFEVVAEVPIEYGETTIRFDVPIDAIGSPEAVDVAAALGDFEGPTDWVPDEGHGTVGGGRAADWISLNPDSGFLMPGRSRLIDVTVGTATTAPGAYVGELRFTSNDPRTPVAKRPVTLTIELPDDFGRITGTVSDEFFEFPIGGAVLTVDATWRDNPYVATTTTGDDGAFSLFVPQGDWPLVVTADGYAGVTTTATVTAGVTSNLDVAMTPLGGIAGLDAGDLIFSMPPGGSDTATIVVTNTGTEPFTFVVREVPGAAFAGEPSGGPAAYQSNEQPAGYSATTVGPRQVNGTWLVFMDELPWGSEGLFIELDNAGVTFDVAGSDAMATTDLSVYDVVIIANDQPDAFYNAYNANVGALEGFALDGGVVWVGAASLGSNGGRFNGFLPGGAPILDEVFEEANHVLNPDHPLTQGLPDPFYGSLASHSGFDGIDAIEGAEVVANGIDSGYPTIVTYPLGAGLIVATGQALEYAWEYGEDAATILVNMPLYLAGLAGPPPDVTWLSAEPIEGEVAPGGFVTITVAVDATGLEAGEYMAELSIRTTDLFGSRFQIPITLDVFIG